MTETMRVPEPVYEALRDVSERHQCSMADAARLALDPDEIRDVSLRAEFQKAKRNEDWERAQQLVDRWLDLQNISGPGPEAFPDAPPATSRDDLPENALRLDEDIDPEQVPDS